MIPHLLLALLSFGPVRADPTAHWAGVPLAELPALGLGVPELDTFASGWRATLPEDGFVRLMQSASIEDARAVFAAQARNASTMALPPLAWPVPPGRDVQAVGDTAGFIVLRDGNVVLMVRDRRGQAGQVARALETALVTEAPPAEPVVLHLGERVLRWDSCGRLF